MAHSFRLRESFVNVVFSSGTEFSLMHQIKRPAALEAFGDWKCPGLGVREALSHRGSFSLSHQLFG
jgi:hypothetical protein